MNTTEFSTPATVIQALQVILEGMDPPVFATLPGDDVILFANRSATVQLGDGCVGRKATELLDLPPELFAAESSAAFEAYCDRTSEWLRATGSDVIWPDVGGAVRLVVCRIVTARKLLDEVNKDMQTLRDSVFVEARNEIDRPLKAIGCIADMIMADQVSPQVRNHAFRIKHSTATLLAALDEAEGGHASRRVRSDSRIYRALADPRQADALARIRGLDAGLGRENMSGSEELYRRILDQYRSVNPALRAQLVQSLDSRDLRSLVLQLHSLKSSTASIGAIALSYRAERLEQAAREADWTVLDHDMGLFIDDMGLLVDSIGRALDNHGEARQPGDAAALNKELDALAAALGAFDPTTAERLLEQLKMNLWPATVQANLDALAEAILLSDFERAETLVDALRSAEFDSGPQAAS